MGEVRGRRLVEELRGMKRMATAEALGRVKNTWEVLRYGKWGEGSSGRNTEGG